MSLKLAICSGIRQFDENRLRDRDWSCRFPGSAWVTSLFERHDSLGIEVASGDVALAKVRSGEWRANEIHVVQELDANHGRELCRRGAVPAVLTVFESPLVAYRSLDRLKRHCAAFRFGVGPVGLLVNPDRRPSTRWLPMRFPCFWKGEVESPVPWNERRYAVLVAANKYWRERTWSRNRLRGRGNLARIIRHGVRKGFSPTYRSSRAFQLHDRRLDLLECLAQRQEIDVFGPGWEHLDNLPSRWEEKLRRVSGIFRGPCDRKRETVRRYRFGIAYENTAWPGYVTEKIIDCFVAGVVPVYLGAPDVSDYVPAVSFLDATRYASPADLADRMRSLPATEAMAMIAAGREYLKSPAGARHSFEGFADWIVALTRETA
ncbi:MAG: glycosyltransferase family 10 domain-containing protein [Candidatus Deferrimicrobiaceae bacterium]